MAPRRPGGAGVFPRSVEPPSAPRPDPAQLYAALDLGTNSCRMLIAQPKGSQFHVVDSFSKSVQLGLGLVFAGWDGDIALPGPGILPWVILIGFAGLGAHYCLTTALSLAPASFVMPIDFARLPLIVIVGAILFGEKADVFILLGGGIIILANWINIRGGKRAAAAPTN